MTSVVPDTFELDGGVDTEIMKQAFGTTLQTPVHLYEDNGGGLHLYQEGRTHIVGGLSPDGDFTDDAQSMAEGGVYWHDWNGQTAYSVEELYEMLEKHQIYWIATYYPDAQRVEVCDDHIGSAGREYLSIVEE